MRRENWNRGDRALILPGFTFLYCTHTQNEGRFIGDSKCKHSINLNVFRKNEIKHIYLFCWYFCIVFGVCYASESMLHNQLINWRLLCRGPHHNHTQCSQIPMRIRWILPHGPLGDIKIFRCIINFPSVCCGNLVLIHLCCARAHATLYTEYKNSSLIGLLCNCLWMWQSWQ